MSIFSNIFGGSQVAQDIINPVLSPTETIIASVAEIIDKVTPDKDLALKIKAELLQTETVGNINNAIAQIQTNQQEAATGNFFIAGPRPWFMWVCANIFAWHYLLVPIIQFFSVSVFGHAMALPVFEMGPVMQISLGLLGLGHLVAHVKDGG